MLQVDEKKIIQAHLQFLENQPETEHIKELKRTLRFLLTRTSLTDLIDDQRTFPHSLDPNH